MGNKKRKILVRDTLTADDTSISRRTRSHGPPELPTGCRKINDVQFHPYNKGNVRSRPLISGQWTPSNLRAHIGALFNHLATGLSAEERQDVERELASNRKALAASLSKRNGSRQSGFVRMLETQKAGREFKQLTNQMKELENVKAFALQELPDEAIPAAKQRYEVAKTALAERLKEAEIDVSYTINAPSTDEYLRLFSDPHEPREGRNTQHATNHDTAKVPRIDSSANTPSAHLLSKPPLWHLIAHALADGTIDQVRAGTHDGLYALGLGERAALDRQMECLMMDDDQHAEWEDTSNTGAILGTTTGNTNAATSDAAQSGKYGITHDSACPAHKSKRARKRQRNPPRDADRHATTLHVVAGTSGVHKTAADRQSQRQRRRERKLLEQQMQAMGIGEAGAEEDRKAEVQAKAAKM